MTAPPAQDAASTGHDAAPVVNPDGVVAVVLAGGRSTRLGRDKALLPFFGRPLLARTADLAASVAGRVLVVGRDPGGLCPDAAWLADDQPGLGPIGGVLTALRHTGRPCLVLSCDLPFLQAGALGRLLDLRARSRTAATRLTVYREVKSGFLESLVAVYEPEGIPDIELSLAGGERRLSAVFAEPARLCLDYDLADPAMARLFLNINRPGDLARARELEAMP